MRAELQYEALWILIVLAQCSPSPRVVRQLAKVPIASGGAADWAKDRQNDRNSRISVAARPQEPGFDCAYRAFPLCLERRMPLIAGIDRGRLQPPLDLHALDNLGSIHEIVSVRVG